MERYGDLIVSDRYFRLANEDGSLSGWIELGRDEAVPETVPVEELYQNSARLEQFRANCKAGKPDQLVWLSRAIRFSMGCRSIPLTGKPCGGSFSCLSEATLLTSADLSESELVEGDGWWQINTVDGVRGILVPEEALTRSVLDLEEVLRQAEEAGYTIVQEPADRSGIPCTYYQLWNSEKTGMYYSFYATEDGSCWFYSDEVDGSIRLAVEAASPA